MERSASSVPDTEPSAASGPPRFGLNGWRQYMSVMLIGIVSMSIEHDTRPPTSPMPHRDTSAPSRVAESRTGTPMPWHDIPSGTSLLNTPIDFGPTIGVLQLSVRDGTICIEPDCIQPSDTRFSVTEIETMLGWMTIAPDTVAAFQDCISLKRTDDGACLVVQMGMRREYPISEEELRTAILNLQNICQHLETTDTGQWPLHINAGEDSLCVRITHTNAQPSTQLSAIVRP